jgi:hypothetical protein
MPTTFVLPEAEPWGRKVSDEFTVPSAAGTIVKSTLPAMKPTGGRSSALIRRLWPERYGSRRIPNRQFE